MKKKTDEIIIGVKGFDKDLKCRDFQYKEGETYEIDKKPIRCTENGFHFCTDPLDIFAYYPPSDSRFHEVEGMGQKDGADEDSKIAVSKIKIGAELSLFSVIKLGIECIHKRVDFKNALSTNTGDSSAATNTGYSSAATNTGYMSAATNIGDRSAATVEGENSVACGLGIENKAKACLGSWIVLTEWKQDKDDNWNIKYLKSAKVDGNKIKEDTFYILHNGKFIEVD